MTTFCLIHSNGFGISAYVYGKAMPDVIEIVTLTDSNYGAVEDFVRGLRENSQSGTLTFDIGSSGWTFNGSNISGDGTLYWTATTITWKRRNNQCLSTKVGVSLKPYAYLYV